MQYYKFAAGERIMVKGAPGRKFFVMEEGAAEVSADGKTLNQLGFDIIRSAV